ncbi:MAG: hypothetical protein ACJ8R9_25315 [Steroidobacteraceae bacterium]
MPHQSPAAAAAASSAPFTEHGAICKQAADSLLSIADRVAAAGIEPMSMEEINAEVKAARAARKERARDS